MINKSDYIAWRDSKETQTLLTELKEAAEGVAAEVLNREDYNMERDQFLKGYLKAIESVLTWRPEFEEDRQNEG
jgi:hypothetical protein